jgi:PAS domain S-box-containing protein
MKAGMAERAKDANDARADSWLRRFSPGSPVPAGRLAAVLFTASGLLGLVTVPLSQPSGASRPAIAAVAFGAMAIGLICWKVPWSRLPAAATLLISIPAFALVDAIGIVGRDPYMFTLFFVIAYVQVGITQRRWVPTAILPLTTLAFLLPPIVLHQDVLVGDVFAIVPISAALAEALAWFTGLFVEANREREDAEVRFQQLVEQSPAAIYTGVTEEGGVFRFEFLSPQLEGILGHRATEWIESAGGWQAAMHPDDRGAVVQMDFYCNRTGEPFRMEYRLQTATGGWVWVRDEAVLAEGEAGGKQRWLGVMTDITPTKEVQSALENSERRYRVLFQSAPDPVWVYDAESLRFLDVNDAAIRRYGYSRDEFLSMTLTDLLPRGDPLALSGASRHRTNGGDVLEVEMLSSSVEFAGAEAARLLLAHDMTTQKHTASELRRSIEELRRSDMERRRLLSRLIRAQEEERKRIALDLHDDPIQKMAALAIRLDMVRTTGDPSGEQIEKLSTTVRETITSLRNLMFRVRPSSLDRGGLAVALETYLEQQRSLHPATAYELENRMTNEPPEDHRVVLYRVAQEALTNVGRHANASNARVVLSNGEGGCEVLIEDDGAGFGAEDTMVSPAGHLGISAMREQAEQVGGWLQIQSWEGTGTVVRCWLPVAEVEAEGAEPAA